MIYHPVLAHIEYPLHVVAIFLSYIEFSFVTCFSTKCQISITKLFGYLFYFFDLIVHFP